MWRETWIVVEVDCLDYPKNQGLSEFRGSTDFLIETRNGLTSNCRPATFP